jgi:phosphonate degradation associated HDIG domain protein
MAQSVDEVVALYDRWGHEHYDEAVSQLDHALQTAALARRDDAVDELVVAALLHDVGHLLEMAGGVLSPEGRDLRHEAEGARYLAALFPPSVTQPIALHVRAKRYRCAVDPTYADALSDGSRASLALQGGPLTGPEVGAFARLPGADTAVRLRGWDDAGKVDGLVTPTLEHHVALLRAVARGDLDSPP